jgi:hypothetical protein
MCYLIFYTFVWDISHSKKNWASFYRKRTEVFIQSTVYSCQILTEHEFSRQIFGKRSINIFHENPSSGSRVVPCGRTDKHDEANSRFSRFYESAWKSISGFSQTVNSFFEFLICNTEIYLSLRGTYWPHIGLQASCRTWTPVLSRLCCNCCLTLHEIYYADFTRP